MAVQQTFQFFAPPAVAVKPTPPKAKGFSRPVKTASSLSTRDRRGQSPDRSEPVSESPSDSLGELLGETGLPGETQAARTQRLLQRLKGRAGGITTASRCGGGRDVFSTGCEAIDRWFPGSGLPTDAISEWVADNEACGASALSLAVVAARMRQSNQNQANQNQANQNNGDTQSTPKRPQGGGQLVVVAGDNHFYPPAAISVGIDPSQMIWVRPTTTADTVWAIDQALRCTGVAVVWAPVGAWLDGRDARRFQLAAEAGQTTGCFVRPSSVRGRPTFAEVRFHVALSEQTHSSSTAHADSSMPTWTLTLDRHHGAGAGSSFSSGLRVGRKTDVTMNEQGDLQSLPFRRFATDETAAVRLASQLADPKTAIPANARRHGKPVRSEPARAQPAKRLA